MASEEDLRNIASQLRCPTGENGVAMGDNMNETNIGMTLASIEELQLFNEEHVLELGFGNAGHLQTLLSSATNIHYDGLDISDTMIDQAILLNKSILEHHDFRFTLYDGSQIPFEGEQFDKIFTVNTIYFWEKPKSMLLEINRVLKRTGVFVLTFARKSFMQTLPFTKYGFTLYEKEDLYELIEHTGFEIIDIVEKSETIRSKVGDLVERKYYVVILKK